jgi:prolipoprotein diacylglyceryltransferase
MFTANNTTNFTNTSIIPYTASEIKTLHIVIFAITEIWVIIFAVLLYRKFWQEQKHTDDNLYNFSFMEEHK